METLKDGSPCMRAQLVHSTPDPPV